MTRPPTDGPAAIATHASCAAKVSRKPPSRIRPSISNRSLPRQHRIAVQLAIALQSMAIAHVKESANHVYRQVNDRTFANFIEIHIAAESPRIARCDRLSGSPGRGSHTTEHRLYGNREFFHML